MNKPHKVFLDLLEPSIVESEQNIVKNLHKLKKDEIIDGIIYLADSGKFGGNSVECIRVLAEELKKR